MSEAPAIHFPTFLRYRVAGRLPLIVVLVVIMALTLDAWPRIAMLAGAAFSLLWGSALLADVRNAWRRGAWANGFDDALTSKQAALMITAAEKSFTLHLRTYTAFGMNAVLPVAVLVEKESGKRYAVKSVTSVLIAACEKSSLETMSE